MADDTDTIIEMLQLLREQATAAAPGAFDKLKQEYQEAKRNAKNAEDWERYQ